MRYTKAGLVKMMRSLLISILLFPVFMGLAIEGNGVIPPAAGAGDPGAGDPGAGAGVLKPGDAGYIEPDPQAGKSPEELEAAETARRAALSDDERAAEDKAADLLAGAPEKYEDFKIPQGMESAQEILEEFVPLMKEELNLSQKKAQSLIDFYTQKVLPMSQAKGLEVWNNEVAGRQEIIANDKEIGGEKLAATKETVNRVAGTFLSKEETDELFRHSARFGDCPAYIKLITRVGAAMSEDGVIVGGDGSSGSGGKTLAQRIYDKSAE